MKCLSKMKKNFVINTKYLPKKDFNEPVYVINANKNFVEAYSTSKEKVLIKQIKIEEELSGKTFISVSDFFKKCKKDNTEYKIEKVDNGDVYIRVAYLDDLSLFFRYRNNTTSLILTNLQKYNFVKTKHNAIEALNKIKQLDEYSILKFAGYLNNLKIIKRDYIFSLKKSKEHLENNLNK